MPMNFPDFQSLKGRAKQRNFRPPTENETEEQYRKFFAEFMDCFDTVEANEIRNKVGWDQWNKNQRVETLFGLYKGERK